ncbi:EAL domain-containing protein, partial [Mesorhizobium sp. M00.F.Ca.ET.217.01.1.1]|uniref:EAL domain-containing protein n=1 Tax=Mesorhizobium sp. M00.F.Ca.ET.217.01.1.1 TaxID=2500529 RepID=UPI001FDFBF74
GEENRHVEVLARLAGKDGRLIPPGEFIPAAERFGIAARLDRWIIRTALSRHGAAMKSGQGVPSPAVLRSRLRLRARPRLLASRSWSMAPHSP